MYTINFFGTGMHYWICKIPILEYLALEKIKNENHETFESLLFDLEFLNEFGYSHWSKIHVIHFGSGLLSAPKNFIEIRKGNRRIGKISTETIVHGNQLFDLYAKQNNVCSHINFDVNFKYLVLIQFNTGLVRKYRINTEKLNMDLFLFYINSLPRGTNFNYDWLTALSYDGLMLDLIVEDVAVTGNRVICLVSLNADSIISKY